MAWIILGGVAGFVLGSILSEYLFGPGRQPARPRPSPAHREANAGAAFLLTTLAAIGGMAAAGLAAA